MGLPLVNEEGDAVGAHHALVFPRGLFLEEHEVERVELLVHVINAARLLAQNALLLSFRTHQHGIATSAGDMD